MTSDLFKNLGGRPPKFETAIEMQEKIEDYFGNITLDEPEMTRQRVDPVDPDDEDEKEKKERIPKLNNAGKPIIKTRWLEIPSILGMCLHIGLDRKNLLIYEEKDEFRNTIKAAKTIIERYNADQLHRDKQVTGIIFNLKNNFDWKDKTEVDNNHSLGISLTDLHKSTQTGENEEKGDSSTESKD